MNRLIGYLVTLGMLLVAFDLMLRLLGTAVPVMSTLLVPEEKRVEFNETRGWANKTSQTIPSKGREFDVDVDFNSLGMRGPEVSEKAPGTTRILMVGDSFTMGWSVEDKDLFLRVLESGLVADGHKVEILNGGTEGYATDQELLWLEEVGAKLKPDYVVLLPYVNDVYWNLTDKYAHRVKCRFEVTADGGVRRVTSTLPRGEEPGWFKRHTSIGNMAYMFSIVGEQAPHKQGGNPLESMALLSSPPQKIQEAWKITDALVGEFSKRVRAMGAKPVAMLVPNKWEIDAEAPIASLQLASYSKSDLAPSKPTDHFKATCEAAGFDVIDPRPALKARHAEGPVYFTHDWHWNEDGNRVVAAELLGYFQGADQLGPGTNKVTRADVLAGLHAPATGGGVPTWMMIVGALWLILGFSYSRSYPRENPVFAFLKVGALIAFVAGVFLGIGKLAASMPPSVGKLVMPLIIIGLLIFIAVKVGKRFGVIGELYNTFLRRGHWYMLPMLVVMLSIGMLLVVAASSPFVAPFIYTLF